MKGVDYELGMANRLGNRSVNQDRIAVAEGEDAVLLILADGMGGHDRGELAAQVLCDSISHHFRHTRHPIVNPKAFLQAAIKGAHSDVIAAGRKADPPIYPRSTCVVCLIQDEHAWWAHVGDSRLYLLRGGRVVDRTRDHTRVEKLFQQGLISEAQMHTHPERNLVTQCVGGEGRMPAVSQGEALLDIGDTILICSDGLWNALEQRLMVEGLDGRSLDDALESVTAQAETASYPHSDNISAVALRWYGQTALKSERLKSDRDERLREIDTDSLDGAIAHIRGAIDKYGDEI